MHLAKVYMLNASVGFIYITQSFLNLNTVCSTSVQVHLAYFSFNYNLAGKKKKTKHEPRYKKEKEQGMYSNLISPHLVYSKGGGEIKQK